jgi:hypothetical protein
MKKLVLATALLLTGVSINSVVAANATINVHYGEPKWMKSKEGTWMGADKTWYKLNTKDASVWWSKDGKKWEMVKDGMWQDKDGKWLKIVDKDLKWSADGGKTWSTVPEWKWQGTDGKWNKFDSEWNLWTA